MNTDKRRKEENQDWLGILLLLPARRVDCVVGNALVENEKNLGLSSQIL